MKVLAVLQELADRLGLEAGSYRTADGRPRWIFLCLAGLFSLVLWIGIGWLLARLAGWLAA